MAPIAPTDYCGMELISLVKLLSSYEKILQRAKQENQSKETVRLTSGNRYLWTILCWNIVLLREMFNQHVEEISSSSSVHTQQKYIPQINC